MASLMQWVDGWAVRTPHLAGAADALLRFCDRLSIAEIETHALPWVERWLPLHENNEDFWGYADLVNRAATVILRLQPSDQVIENSDLRRRVRQVLARLADNGSLTAREAMAAIAAQRPGAASR
ncbi:MAG: hypothetical protein B7Z12_06745 [Caulobacter vibrioides]|uniref:Uncharacterized protein n=1 Tax=Caulobacter vibrioides TaxID=155892 RepID=A0A258D8V0_CAUVI|nr:MAG: hypothetical protein B7Z12_06745 [Caulobacter vibrioides]